MDKWTDRTGESNEPSEPLHKMIERFLNTPVSGMQQKMLHNYHLELSDSDYADSAAAILREELHKHISRAQEYARSTIPSPEAAIEELGALRQSDTHYLKELHLDPPGKTEKFHDTFKLAAFIMNARAARKKRWIEIGDQVYDIVKEKPSPKRQKEIDTAKEYANAAERLSQLSDALNQLAIPADKNTYESQLKIGKFIETEAIHILADTFECYKKFVTTFFGDIANDGIKKLSRLPEEEKEAAVFRLKEFLIERGGIFEADISGNSYQMKANPDTIVEAYKVAELIDDEQFHHVTKTMERFRNILINIEDMQLALLPIIDKIRGKGRSKEVGSEE